MTTAATIIPPFAVIGWMDNAMTSATQVGLEASATRSTVTTTCTAIMHGVTSLTITVLTSLCHAENASFTHPNRSIAAHADF